MGCSSRRTHIEFKLDTPEMTSIHRIINGMVSHDKLEVVLRYPLVVYDQCPVLPADIIRGIRLEKFGFCEASI